MYAYAFKRVEKKYLLTEAQKEKLLKKINTYLEEDVFYRSPILNIYFDTKENDLIINSLEKPVFKEKLRLRSYKIPNLEDYVFLEIKRKYKGIVGKRRIKIKLKEFYNYLENGIINDKQVMKEIDYCFKFYNLKPAIFIGYDRESYKVKDNNDLRITFDTNLRSRYEDLRLELGDNGKLYFKEKMYIMEIKTLGSIPIWLVKSLPELEIFPTSFSKYGKIYEKTIKEEYYA